MTGIVALIEATPRRPADGSPVTVRLCWNAVTRGDFFGEQWYPGIVTLPSFETTLGFDGYKFGQGATPTVGQLVIGLDPVTAPLASLVWKNAAITLRIALRPPAGDPADGDFAVAWSGRADVLSEKDGLLTIVALDAGQALRKPVQPVLFGSSGSALLDGADAVDKAGQPVPVGWGTLSAVPAILVDKSYNIWLLLGRPAASIASIEDGGYPLTLGIARANLDALRATAPAAGAADYCLNAEGLVLTRPWDTPTYPLIADLTAAGGTTAAGIAAAIVGARSGLGFTAGTVAAFDALVPAACQLYVADGKTVAEALDLLFPPLGAFWKLNSAGTIDLGRLTRAAASTRDLGNARAGAVTRLATVLPTGRRTLGYATNNRVLGTNEIAKALTADNAGAIGGVPAATILGEVATAAAGAAAATAELADIASDGVLIPSEKSTAIRDADVLAGEQAKLDAQALAFGVTIEKAAYDTAIGGLTTYLGGLVAPTAWNDLTGNTTIDGATFRGKFDAAFNARTALLAALAMSAALWENQSGVGLPQDNATANRADDELNRNSSFEMPVNADGTVPGWALAHLSIYTTLAVGNDVGALRGSKIAIVTGRDYLISEPFAVATGATIWTAINTYCLLGSIGTVAGSDPAYLVANIQFYTPGDAYVGAFALFAGETVPGTTHTLTLTTVVPAGASLARLTFQQDIPRSTNTSARSQIDYFTASSRQPGADVTGQNKALDTTNIAGQDAATFTAAAATASLQAAVASAQLGIIASSTYLSRDKKPALGNLVEAINQEAPGIQAQLDHFALARAGFDAALNAFYTYISNLTPNWNDATRDTPIVSNDFNAAFSNYYAAKKAALSAIAAQAGAQASGLTLAQGAGSLTLNKGAGSSVTVPVDSRMTGQTFAAGVQVAYSTEPLSATSSGSSSTIVIAAHTVTYSGAAVVNYAGGSIAGLSSGVTYAVYADDPTFAGGTQSYVATTNFSDLSGNPGRRLVGYIATPAAGSTGTGTGTGGGTGGGGRPGPGGAIP